MKQTSSKVSGVADTKENITHSRMNVWDVFERINTLWDFKIEAKSKKLPEQGCFYLIYYDDIGDVFYIYNYRVVWTDSGLHDDRYYMVIDNKKTLIYRYYGQQEPNRISKTSPVLWRELEKMLESGSIEFLKYF